VVNHRALRRRLQLVQPNLLARLVVQPAPPAVGDWPAGVGVAGETTLASHLDWIAFRNEMVASRQIVRGDTDPTPRDAA
jgi:hypothetical protein